MDLEIFGPSHSRYVLYTSEGRAAFDKVLKRGGGGRGLVLITLCGGGLVFITGGGGGGGGVKP